MLSPIKLGWVAGVLDLKGRLITKANTMRATPQIILMVETKEFAVIRELSNLTGTKPQAMEKRPLKDFMRRGCAEHCPEAHFHVYDDRLEGLYMPPIARWTITGAGMYVVLHNVMPYIQIDRGYSEAMADVLAATVFTGQGAAAVMRSLTRLYGLGWEMPEEFEQEVLDAIAG